MMSLPTSRRAQSAASITRAPSLPSVLLNIRTNDIHNGGAIAQRESTAQRSAAQRRGGRGAVYIRDLPGPVATVPAQALFPPTKGGRKPLPPPDLTPREANTPRAF